MPFNGITKTKSFLSPLQSHGASSCSKTSSLMFAIVNKVCLQIWIDKTKVFFRSDTSCKNMCVWRHNNCDDTYFSTSVIQSMSSTPFCMTGCRGTFLPCFRELDLVVIVRTLVTWNQNIQQQWVLPHVIQSLRQSADSGSPWLLCRALSSPADSTCLSGKLWSAWWDVNSKQT